MQHPYKIMKHLYNVHPIFGKPININTYTSKGLVIGRPQPIGSTSIDELEKDGWIGVYDPSDDVDLGKTPQCTGSIVVDLGPNPFANMDLGKIVKSMEIEPESTLDDRIKEVKQQKHKNYRARWTGTKYVYDPI